MKKYKVIILATIISLLLCGCSTNVSKQEKTNASDGVMLSLADNSIVKAKYFSDEECSIPIESGEYLGKIYASLPEIKKDYNKHMYTDFQFVVDVYTENDDEDVSESEKWSEKTRIKCTDGGNLELFEITEDSQYSKVRIYPVCRYNNTKKLDFSVVDEQGKSLDSKDYYWEIEDGNDLEITDITSDSKIIDSTLDFIVRLKYKNLKYYYLSSNPDEIWRERENAEDGYGYVEFHFQEADDENISFDVTLQTKTQYRIINDTNKELEICKDGQNWVEFKEEQAYAKEGTEIQVRFKNDNGEINILDVIETENLNIKEQNGSTVIYTVEQESGEYVFNPVDYTYENGELEFYKDDKFTQKITESVTMSTGEKVYFKAIPNEGYYFNAKTENNFVAINIQTEHILKNNFEFVNAWTVPLLYPDDEGKITYYLDKDDGKGKVMISETTDSIYYVNGRYVLTAYVEPAPGYTLNELSEKEVDCFVEEDGHDIIFGGKNGKKINELFTLVEAKKANLNVEIDKSVGKELDFTIKSIDDSFDGLSYTSKNDGDVVTDQKVNTVNGFKITALNGMIEKNHAIKIVAEIETKDGKELTKIGYITEIPQTYNIELDNDVFYEDIEIKILNASGMKTHKSNNYSFEGLDVKLYMEESGDVIKDGDSIENDLDVSIELTPKDGYKLYVDEGKFLGFGQNFKKKHKYRIEDFKYSDLNEEWEDLLEKIDVRKE